MSMSNFMASAEPGVDALTGGVRRPSLLGDGGATPPALLPGDPAGSGDAAGVRLMLTELKSGSTADDSDDDAVRDATAANP